MTTDRSTRTDSDRRLAWLIDTLRHHGKLTFGQLAALWLDCPVNTRGDVLALRTFHHHRRAARETLGVEIVCDPRDGYTYSISHPERLEHDALLSRMIDSQAAHGVAPAGSVEAAPPSGGHEHVASIAQAMARGRAVELIWNIEGAEGSANASWQQKLRLEPFHLKESGNDWWVVGRDIKADEVKACCLGDLADMRVLDTVRFQLPADWDAKAWLEGCTGMLREEPLEKVVIRVRYHARERLARHPLHPSQRQIGRDAKSVTYEYRVRPNYDFVQALMALTDQVEVMEPQTLRDELNRVAFRLIEFYNRGR